METAKVLLARSLHSYQRSVSDCVIQL